MSVMKDAGDIKGSISKFASGLKGIFKGAVAAYIIAVPVHDVWTGGSMISKTWNSTVVAGLDDTGICKDNKVLEDSFICKPRGDGKDLGTLVPGFLK